MAKLRRDHVMVAREMVARDVSVREAATHLGVDESTLRYHLARPAAGADGRAERASALDGWEGRVTAVLVRFGDARVTPGAPTRCQARQVFDALQREHGFAGSYQAVRRYLRRAFGAPPVQALRRVELPPGVQAQHDWFDWPGVIGGEPCALHGLIGTLAFSRATFVWVSRTMTQVAWQTGHLALFTRYGGVPLWVRHDNLTTAVAAGAGPTAVFNRAFVVFATSCGFQLDACRAATGSDKGKVERQVRTDRGAFLDLLLTPWPSLEALQAAADERSAELHARRRCPATGTTVAEALRQERAALRPVPAVHEPFDCVVARRVSRDCLVSFEGRRYSVPFAWVGRLVEIRGTAAHVVIYGEGAELARHPRHTARRLVLAPAHYEGPSTPTVLAPTPLGARARAQLAAQVAALPAPHTLTRPLAAYLTLLEGVSR
jgi:transposase